MSCFTNLNACLRGMHFQNEKLKFAVLSHPNYRLRTTHTFLFQLQIYQSTTYLDLVYIACYILHSHQLERRAVGGPNNANFILRQQLGVLNTLFTFRVTPLPVNLENIILGTMSKSVIPGQVIQKSMVRQLDRYPQKFNATRCVTYEGCFRQPNLCQIAICISNDMEIRLRAFIAYQIFAWFLGPKSNRGLLGSSLNIG